MKYRASVRIFKNEVQAGSNMKLGVLGTIELQFSIKYLRNS